MASLDTRTGPCRRAPEPCSRVPPPIGPEHGNTSPGGLPGVWGAGRHRVDPCGTGWGRAPHGPTRPGARRFPPPPQAAGQTPSRFHGRGGTGGSAPGSFPFPLTEFGNACVMKRGSLQSACPRRHADRDHRRQLSDEGTQDRAIEESPAGSVRRVGRRRDGPGNPPAGRLRACALRRRRRTRRPRWFAWARYGGLLPSGPALAPAKSKEGGGADLWRPSRLAQPAVRDVSWVDLWKVGRRIRAEESR